MTEKPLLKLVSVIIPAYNAEAFISDAIHSILEQDYEYYEIIVIDDGSNDQTSKVVNTIQDERIRFIQQPNNQGASAARNRGMQEAKGEYLAFLDADDLWSPYFLTTMLETISQHKFDLLFCNSIRSRNSETLSWEAPLHKPGIEKSLQNIFSNPYMATGALLFRREVLKKIHGFNTDLKTAEDIDFVLRIAEHYCIGHLPEALVQVKVRPGSLGNQAGAYRDNLTVLSWFFQRHPDFHQHESVRVRHLLEDIYYCYLRQLIVDRDLTGFRKVVKEMPWSTLSLRSLKLCGKALALQLLRKGKTPSSAS